MRAEHWGMIAALVLIAWAFWPPFKKVLRDWRKM